jgi:hypothetical protein
MALPDKHPEYIERLGEYVQMADTYAGERAVKSKRLDYLPASEGMVQDGMTTPSAPGWRDYEAYLLRAVFHDVVREAVKAMVGIIHERPAEIQVPKRLEGMIKRATISGEDIHMLHRRITVAQFVYGRCGLLGDVPTGQDVDKVMPYISFYDPIRIINWDAGKLDEGKNELALVVIDEGGYRREGFNWKTERKYRVLARGLPENLDDSWDRPDGDAPFGVCVKVNETTMPIGSDFVYPEIGGKTLNKIPFVFIGANDLVPEPEIPPLLGLSNLALAIYRGEADYRQTLYAQGQQTLVVIGGAVDEAAPTQLRTGNKGVIDLKIGGDAKYIGVSATGLSEMRQALKTDLDRAAAEGVQFLDSQSEPGESGEALRIRVAAKTTTVGSVARAGASGLEQMLKMMAEWVGENPDDVKVKANTDFADQTVAGAALLAFMQAKQLGLPLSLKSIHGRMKVNNFTDMDFDQENEQIEEEAASMLGTAVGVGQQPPADENYLDDPQAGGPGAGGDPGQPPPQPGSVAPPNKNVPVTPHTRGSPVPLKRKVGPKGASAK